MTRIAEHLIDKTAPHFAIFAIENCTSHLHETKSGIHYERSIASSSSLPERKVVNQIKLGLMLNTWIAFLSVDHTDESVVFNQIFQV
jgi:hypothetical protein